ncbi:cold-regulated protein 27-like [Andrographis paniculata]|uniref:cold-regulated protein 27-like n=1 Tax=Andrographis paniculata TaxID=175694 RepID=UPI0021E88219|nr:cold-regulated protein 27-like [Andrographis paniculata]
MEDCADSSARNSPMMQEEATSTLMATAAESKPGKWTDEKHCMFLKSMESMFVNQLYKSIDTFGWHSGKHCLSGSDPTVHIPAGDNSSSQFKVVCDGHSSKTKFRRKGHGLNQEDESKVPSARRKCSKQNPRHSILPVSQDSVGSNTEVTDQNFIDDALEEGQSTRSRKRSRSRTIVASGTDQVVPICNNVGPDNVAEDHFC